MSEITVIDAQLEISEETIQKIMEAEPVNHITVKERPVKSAEQQHVPVSEYTHVTTAEEQRHATAAIQHHTTAVTEPQYSATAAPIHTIAAAEPHHVTIAAEPHHTTTAVELHHTTATDSQHATAVEVHHVTTTAEPHHTTAMAQHHAVAESKPIVTLGSEHFAVSESKIDAAAVLLNQAAHAVGFTEHFEVVTHNNMVCDMVFTDGEGRHMTTYVKQEKDKNPTVIVDLEGFKPGSKECSKKMDAIIKYLTERGVVARAKRSIHNRPDGILRNKLKGKKTSSTQKNKAISEYLNGTPKNISTQKHNQ